MLIAPSLEPPLLFVANIQLVIARRNRALTGQPPIAAYVASQGGAGTVDLGDVFLIWIAEFVVLLVRCCVHQPAGSGLQSKDGSIVGLGDEDVVSGTETEELTVV